MSRLLSTKLESVSRCAFLALSLGGSLFGQVVAPALTSTPSTLTFTWQTGTAVPAAQGVAVKSGSLTAAYVTAITPPTALWLAVSPDSGKLPATLRIVVNPSSLPVGTYVAAVQLTAVGITNPAVISVTLIVESPPPTLTLSATSLNFVTPPNPPATQTLTLSTTGGPVPFAVAAQTAAWMTVTPTSGVVLPGLPITLTVSVDATGIDPQATAYTGKLLITASGVPAANKTQNVAVSLLVNSLPPTIASLWPSAILAGSGPLTVTIRGTGFYKATTAKAVGSPTPLKTTVVSPTTLLADVPASLLIASGPLNLVASNPAPGGDSAPSTFTVSATPVIQTVASAASYVSGTVSPGELVTLFGSGIGPAAPAGMSIVAGFITQTLAGVSVTIDGQNAAMIYVSQNQLTVQVPYDATIGTARVIAVDNNGTISNGLVDIAATAPGLFALDGSGLGQAAALTFSMKTGLLSVNGSANPARIGDVIVLYLTGEGIYAPLILPATGYIVPLTLTPLPQVSPLPAVTVGGIAASVQYAGPMPGGVIGVLQINAVVPTGLVTGGSVPVSVTIGGVSTQTGVTIVVK